MTFCLNAAPISSRVRFLSSNNSSNRKVKNISSCKLIRQDGGSQTHKIQLPLGLVVLRAMICMQLLGESKKQHVHILPGCIGSVVVVVVTVLPVVNLPNHIQSILIIQVIKHYNIASVKVPVAVYPVVNPPNHIQSILIIQVINIIILVQQKQQ